MAWTAYGVAGLGILVVGSLSALAVWRRHTSWSAALSLAIECVSWAVALGGGATMAAAAGTARVLEYGALVLSLGALASVTAAFAWARG